MDIENEFDGENVELPEDDGEGDDQEEEKQNEDEMDNEISSVDEDIDP